MFLFFMVSIITIENYITQHSVNYRMLVYTLEELLKKNVGILLVT